MTVDFILRPAVAADEERLYAIHKAALGEYVEATWGWDEAWQRQYFRDHFARESLQAITVEGQVVGLLQVGVHPDHIDCVNIEIAPAWQGRTIGTTVLRRLLEQAILDGHGTVRLQVLKANPRAVRLYQRLCFVTTGESATHRFMQHQSPAR